MTDFKRRALLAGVGMALISAAGAVATPRRHLADELPPLDLEGGIPRQLGGWSVDQAMITILPTPDVQQELGKLYNKVLSRTYVDAQGQRVMFVIAYGADQADRMTLAHLPEACYSTQGFDVFPTTVVSVPVGGHSFSVLRLRTRKAVRVEPVTYWTTVGGEALVDEVNRRWARAKYSLRGLIPDGMLVRVSTIDTEETRAFGVHASFIDQLYGALDLQMRSRLFGEGMG